MVHYLDSELFTLVNIKCTNKIIYTITMSTTFSSDAWTVFVCCSVMFLFIGNIQAVNISEEFGFQFVLVLQCGCLSFLIRRSD